MLKQHVQILMDYNTTRQKFGEMKNEKNLNWKMKNAYLESRDINFQL